MREAWVWSLGQEDPLEKAMATHSSTLAWKIPWMEEPGGLQSMGPQRVRHDWATSSSFFLSARVSALCRSRGFQKWGWRRQAEVPRPRSVRLGAVLVWLPNYGLSSRHKACLQSPVHGSVHRLPGRVQAPGWRQRGCRKRGTGRWRGQGRSDLILP